jgi:hypothetical protein
LSPSDFGQPTPTPAPPQTSTSSEDARLAGILAALKTERERLGSRDPAQVADAERKIALQAGYLAGLLEARGTVIPVNSTFYAPATLAEAVDHVIRALEEATRIAPLLAFAAGVLCGYMACRAASCS